MLRGDLVYVWRIVSQNCAIKLDDLFQTPHINTTGEHPYKLYAPMVSLYIRKRFLTYRVIRHSNAVSAGTVMSTSIGAFKSLLERDLALD